MYTRRLTFKKLLKEIQTFIFAFIYNILKQILTAKQCRSLNKTSTSDDIISLNAAVAVNDSIQALKFYAYELCKKA